MSLTKEMIMSVEDDVAKYDNEELLNYHSTYKFLAKTFPNSFYEFRVKRSYEEIVNRGLEKEVYAENNRNR